MSEMQDSDQLPNGGEIHLSSVVASTYIAAVAAANGQDTPPAPPSEAVAAFLAWCDARSMPAASMDDAQVAAARELYLAMNPGAADFKPDEVPQLADNDEPDADDDAEEDAIDGTPAAVAAFLKWAADCKIDPAKLDADGLQAAFDLYFAMNPDAEDFDEADLPDARANATAAVKSAGKYTVAEACAVLRCTPVELFGTDGVREDLLIAASDLPGLATDVERRRAATAYRY